jgi:hypothetical protein
MASNSALAIAQERQRCDSIQEAVVSAVHQENEMRKEVHTDDGMRDVAWQVVLWPGLLRLAG